MPSAYDAVVIGAGPAGSMAAHEIASAGQSVLLLEKHKRPGLPLCCAEAVSRPSFDKIMAPEPQWISTEIERVLMVSPGGEKANILHPRAGYVLDRVTFDNDLARRAAEAGADLRCEAIGIELNGTDQRFSSMTVMGPDEKQYQVSARIFVAADGVESKVARLAGMNNMIDTYDVEALLQYRLEDVDVDADKMEFYFGNRIAPRGYVWVFPKSDRSANVGLGVSSALEPGVRSKAYLDEFIRKRFKKYRITGTFCGLVPRFQGGDKFKMKNLLIAGDAARSDDSLSGAGIVNALLSGIFAGKAAAAFIRGDVTGGRDLAELYPGAFLKIKENELKMYSRFREIYNRLDDDDFDDIIKYLEGHLGGRPIESLSPLKILSGVIMKRARLLRMAKYLF